MPIGKALHIDVDLYKTIKKEGLFSVNVQVKNTFRVRLGLFFIKIGCYLSGANFVNEFPMSLIQNDQLVEMDK